MSEELQREKQAPNIVKQNKTIPQGYKSSMSTPISHVENLNKSRESGQQSGHSK